MIRPGTILLVSPEWKGIGKQKQPQLKRIWQPLDLAIAAALLETEGFRVKILDNNIGPCEGDDRPDRVTD